MEEKISSSNNQNNGFYEITINGETYKCEYDSLFKDALKFVMKQGYVKKLHEIQSKFSIGYARAARIIDQMEDKGYISKPIENSNKRKVLITPEMFKEEFGEDFDSI